MAIETLVEATEDTPKIEIDKDSGILELSGRSLPENAVAFYRPLNDWLNEYVKNPCTLTIVKIFLDYYNSASARQMFDVFLTLEELIPKGYTVVVKWYYKKGDELMLERGLELKEISKIHSEIIEK